jgi:hypothetical protein
MTKSESEMLKEKLRTQMGEMTNIFKKLPACLMLILRNMNIVRSINLDLGENNI